MHDFIIAKKLYFCFKYISSILNINEYYFKV
ncbi:hypothetical protein HMH39_000580 [Campylobacter jejuni]|uniref:Uncharacterized protein n=1 Tax=Campylobacter jejuni TaxID=197 RepID=A0A5Z0BTR6_CAMJU|nr:hypothetical protein [Campylobacter jejuni]EAH7561736.1 hypothetical protein [Campylobacter jejuni]EAH9956347.1 hypothetical protein [Campylobacter jejuni]EAH9972416.1 hypothetical protein [Campylobacter jejuni]EAI1516938.1 hypothetical protein [Campylobacter jejuni]